MKKIVLILMTTVAALLMFASCNLNDYPVFDDANAFVSFKSPTMSCSEDAGEINVTVILSSVAGLNESIKYACVDSTAKAGVDYELLDSNATLTFDSENRTLEIPIRIINRPGEYTKDLVFKLVFSDTGDISEGASNECIVTIQDLDHPLSYILGTYTAKDALGNSWSMTLSKDASDESIVWFYDLCNLGSWVRDDIMYYGVVNTENNTISIPWGQESEYTYSNGNAVLLVGMTPADQPGYYDVFDEGYFVMEISDNGATLTMPIINEATCIGGYIPDAGIVCITPLPITLKK